MTGRSAQRNTLRDLRLIQDWGAITLQRGQSDEV